MSRVGRTALLLVLVFGACTSAPPTASELRAEGPPRVQRHLVLRHAEQFDEDLERRPAGSQQEEAAAAYILGHLQRAGYVARLEAVPVADTVNSTDVIAVPPSGTAPTRVVAVPYDTTREASDDGTAIGLFLELGRALKAVAPRHDVEFVALGAERTPLQQGHLGARRLAKLLLDEGADPQVITIESVGGPSRGSFGAFGDDVAGVVEVARHLHIPILASPAPGPGAGRDLTGRAEVFVGAGFDHVAVTGGIEQVGRVLLRYLSSMRER
ncbi:MAG: hypothetical protein ABR529_03245 [Actinomycetota bacterium]